MNKPKVGITTLNPKANIENYLKAVTSSDGEAVLLIPDESTQLQVLTHLDGLLLTGGGDIPPYFWGENSKSSIDPKDELRARFELPLVREAAQKGIPILGICLGLQMINVALGGTLHVDLPLPSSAKLHSRKRDGTSSYHRIEVAQGTKLSAILPRSLKVNSRHHQAIKELAAGLKISAKAEDGMIEAIEKDGSEWWVGVQWHPEDLFQTQLHQQRIFQSFIQACKR